VIAILGSAEAIMSYLHDHPELVEPLHLGQVVAITEQNKSRLLSCSLTDLKVVGPIGAHTIQLARERLRPQKEA
jgi:hypothetical protein